MEQSNYEYGFEIEDILKQFFALIDKSVIMRYEKVENERRLVQTITPFYKFTTKNRALLLSLNSSKNFTLPCVVVEVTGIKADKNRLAAKKSMISRFKNGIVEGYNRPTPITISVQLNIITKYKSDLFQIYGKLATQFQPECFISWMVPTNHGIKGIEELRNKVEWDFNISIDSNPQLKETDEERYTGKMNFDIEGWIFPNHKTCQNDIIFDVGTTELVTSELESRLDGLSNINAPLTSVHGSNYKNPRQLATSHVRILKAFTTIKLNNKNYYFRISDNNYGDYKLDSDRDYFITFDGYNLNNCSALLVPTEPHELTLEEYIFDDNFSKVSPKLGEADIKSKSIQGIPITITSKNDNTLVVKLPKISYKGNFDIILYDTIDYDTFYNSEGFYLNARN